MSTAHVVAVPGARAWRAKVRRARRAHHDRTFSEVFNDLYALLWLVVVYGGALLSAVLRHLATPAPRAAAEARWIAVAALLTAGGLAWQLLRSMGPVLSTAAEQAWGVSTPLDRGSFLRPRLLVVLALTGAVGAVAGSGITVGLHGSALGWSALAGATWGLALAGLSVVAQGAGDGARWPRLLLWLLIGGGAVTTVLVVAPHGRAAGLPQPPELPAALLAVAGVVAAVVATARSVRVLGRLHRASLNVGAQLAEATTAATVGLDPSVLTRVLEVRRWRRVGSVTSRRFRLGSLGRTAVLLEAEVRRQLRRPGALAIWAGLALAQYALSLVAPSLAGPGRLILAYVATNRLASGLRSVGRSPGLRRALGGQEGRVRLVHLVVPALGAALWWLVTMPAGDPGLGGAGFVLVSGVVTATHRSATRPPLDYGGAVMETPLGLVPVELIMQLARGPDVLGAMIVLRWLLLR